MPKPIKGTFVQIFKAGADPDLVVSAVGLTVEDIDDFEANGGYPLDADEKAGLAKLRAAVLARESDDE